MLKFLIFKSSKNLFDFSRLSLPTFIGNISMLRKFGLFYKLSRDGISSLHGTQKKEKKLSNINLPL